MEQCKQYVSLVFLMMALVLQGCTATSATPVVVNQVGALSQVRMVTSVDPKGEALRAYPSGTATVWCALEVYGSKLNGTDSYALRIMDTSGSSIAQVEIINNANLQLPKGAQVIMGGPVNPHKLAVPLASAAGAFPDGEYRLEIVLNGQVGASIPWTVGTVSR
jgi:hypothetical protein